MISMYKSSPAKGRVFGMPSAETLELYRKKIEAELFHHVLPFWNQHSVDLDRGGFYACLDEAGEIYDRRKFMWLNGRQIYMYATVAGSYTSDEVSSLSAGKLSREKLLRDAEAAADFMYTHGVRTDGKVFFSLAEDGQPYHMERKIFSACFLCLGIGCLGAVLKDDGQVDKAQKLLGQCTSLLKRIVTWGRDPSLIGREAFAGAPVTSAMNVPMIILNLLQELQTKGTLLTDMLVAADIDITTEEEWCVSEILKHVNFEKKQVLETVLADGAICPGYDGRHMNPGHAIEAGWFLLQYAQLHGKPELVEVAEQMITWSFEAGWDADHGGIFYFLDSEGRSPVYLEWDMKLWWPHNEAMIAFAMLYELQGKEQHWESFVKVTDYAMSHFSEPGNGEWYGYLNREGKVTHRFKGGPYKGCFHVPRSLFIVLRILGHCSAKAGITSK